MTFFWERSSCEACEKSNLFDLELCDTYCDDVRLRDGQSPFSSSNLHHFSSASQVRAPIFVGQALAPAVKQSDKSWFNAKKRWSILVQKFNVFKFSVINYLIYGIISDINLDINCILRIFIHIFYIKKVFCSIIKNKKTEKKLWILIVYDRWRV